VRRIFIANIKVNIEAEINDEVLSKLLESLRIAETEETTSKAPL
jgi:hypothetical protein